MIKRFIQRGCQLRPNACVAANGMNPLLKLSFTVVAFTRYASLLKLGGKLLVLEASYVCSNVVPYLKIDENYVFFCLLGITRVVIWTI